MKRCRLTPGAQQDLSEIWDVTQERWDIRQAEAYTHEIRAAVERVVEDPRRGGGCGEIRRGYRC